jgi:GNAT superfamily N-acetyltransferase
MAVQIAPFDGSEQAYRRRVALLKEAQPEEPWSLEGQRAADAVDAAAGRSVCAFFAVVDAEEQGFARAQFDPDVPVLGRRRLWVVVTHGARRRGLGTALLQAVGAAAASQGATEFHASTSLAEPDGLAFALARGFRQVEAEVELHLDLASFEAVPAPPGVEVASLAALRSRYPDWPERYYRLHTAVEAEVPWALGYAVPGRDEFRAAHVDAPEALAEGTAIAAVDGDWVGLCELWRSGDGTHTAYEELTGVLPPYRRRGLGAALVSTVACWSREHGYRRLLTSTSIRNAPMQALAARLGFRVEGRWSHLLGLVGASRVPSGREVGR